jgi:hypothetical protein
MINDIFVPLSDLQTGLATLGASPSDHGTVEMIVCRPSIGERLALDQAKVDLLEGLIGDNWRARGSTSTEDGSANPDTQITIMNSHVIQVIAQERDRWQLAGDQLFIDLDLSVDNLPPGQHIQIGTAILEISGIPHTGCKKFTERYGNDATRFINSAEGRQNRWRGLNARVIQPGAIRVGDKTVKIAAE